MAQPAIVEALTVESIPEGGVEIAMEVPSLPVPKIAERQSTLGVHLDFVRSDAVVTVDEALLASPERDRESRVRRVSNF